MKKISSIEELRVEQKRLREKKALLELEIEDNYKAIKQDLSPLNFISSRVKKIVTSDQNGLVDNSIGGIVDFIFSKIIFRNAGLLTRIIVPFFAGNATKNFFHDNKTEILGWLGTWITKLRDKKGITSETVYVKSTTDTDL